MYDIGLGVPFRVGLFAASRSCRLSAAIPQALPRLAKAYSYRLVHLITELTFQSQLIIRKKLNDSKEKVSTSECEDFLYSVIPLGLEPKTPSLKVMCSTS